LVLFDFKRQALAVQQSCSLDVIADRLFHQAYVGFRRFCVESENLPTDLHIVLSDILQEAGMYKLSMLARVSMNFLFCFFILYSYMTLTVTVSITCFLCVENIEYWTA